MASTIAAGLTNSTALVYTADTSGVLQLQTNGTTTAVTIDTSQNVGIGVTSPNSYANFKTLTIAGTNGGVIDLITGSTVQGEIVCNTNELGIGAVAASGNLTLRSGGNVERARIDSSGNLLVGTTSNGGYVTKGVFAFASASANAALQTRTDTTSASTAIFFYNPNGYVGSIVTSASATAYNTSSDRRLKTNIATLTNSGAIIDALQPRTFTWIADNSADVGFIADEIQQVLPKAVTGQPNATKEEEYEVTPAVKDEQGNITTPAVMGTRTVPVYQMIDASQPELIAYLVAEIQSLRARLKAANIA